MATTIATMETEMAGELTLTQFCPPASLGLEPRLALRVEDLELSRNDAEALATELTAWVRSVDERGS